MSAVASVCAGLRPAPWLAYCSACVASSGVCGQPPDLSKDSIQRRCRFWQLIVAWQQRSVGPDDMVGKGKCHPHGLSCFEVLESQNYKTCHSRTTGGPPGPWHHTVTASWHLHIFPMASLFLGFWFRVRTDHVACVLAARAKDREGFL